MSEKVIKLSDNAAIRIKNIMSKAKKVSCWSKSGVSNQVVVLECLM